MRKPDFCICENKDADQLRGNHEADQRRCFRYIDSTIPLLPIWVIIKKWRNLERQNQKNMKKLKVQYFGLSLIISLTRAWGNNIESLRCFTRAITHQGLVLLHATYAKMSVQSQLNFFSSNSLLIEFL